MGDSPQLALINRDSTFNVSGNVAGMKESPQVAAHEAGSKHKLS